MVWSLIFQSLIPILLGGIKSKSALELCKVIYITLLYHNFYDLPMPFFIAYTLIYRV